MKIFNNENGKKVVYVQLNDLTQILNDSEKGIPQSVMHKVFSDMFIVTDENRYEFKRFDEEHEVEFFENLDWSIDYKKVRDLSEEQILELAYEIADKMNVYAEQINALENANKVDHYELFTRYELLRFKYLSLRDVLWFKQGHLSMEIPIVPDNDHIHPLAMNSKFTAYVGLNPQQLLICKQNGAKFEMCDTIDDDFIKSALNDLIKMNQDNNEYFNDFEIDDYFTKDCMYFVTSLKIRNKKPTIVDKVKRALSLKRKK